MGKKSREKQLRKENSVRVQTILNTEGEISEAEWEELRSYGLSDKNIRNARNRLNQEVESTVRAELEEAPLAIQIAQARKYMSRLPVSNFKKLFLPGFRNDVKDRVKKVGREEAMSYYLDCPEFVQFWSDIGMTLEDLDGYAG